MGDQIETQGDTERASRIGAAAFLAQPPAVRSEFCPVLTEAALSSWEWAILTRWITFYWSVR